MKNSVLIATLLLLPLLAQAEAPVDQCTLSPDHKTFSTGCKPFYKFSRFVSGNAILTAKPGVNDDLSAAINQQSRTINAEKLAASDINNALVPHGLWLNLLDESKQRSFFPAFCKDIPINIDTFPPALLSKMDQYYVDVTYDLYQHEWSKHGSCIEGITPAQYFTNVFQLLDQYQAHSQFIREYAGKTLPYDVVQQDLVKDSNSMELICEYDKLTSVQFLEQIWLNLDANLKPLPLTDATRTKPSEICDNNKPIYIPAAAPYTNVSKLIASLPQSPINVGFDIDGTILDSSLLFAKASRLFGKQSDQFWPFVNKSDKDYSLVKKTAKLLIKHHQKRQDTIHFITARPATDDQTLSQLLAKIFNIQAEQVNLVFTDNPDKTQWLRQDKIALYYGDADSDISSTIKADARPIRILRSLRNNSHSSYRPGHYGETVILNSNL